MYIDKLDDKDNKYNNTYQSTIKMKLVDIKSNTFVNSRREIDNKDPKFKIDNIVRISKYENVFAKGYTSNWSEEVSVIKKVKNTVPWTYVLNDLNSEKVAGTFSAIKLQKTYLKKFRTEKVTKRKGDKLYVKWKGIV